MKRSVFLEQEGGGGGGGDECKFCGWRATFAILTRKVDLRPLATTPKMNEGEIRPLYREHGNRIMKKIKIRLSLSPFLLHKDLLLCVFVFSSPGIQGCVKVGRITLSIPQHTHVCAPPSTSNISVLGGKFPLYVYSRLRKFRV